MDKILSVDKETKLLAYTSLLGKSTHNPNLEYISSITYSQIPGIRAKLKTLLKLMNPKNMFRRLIKQDEYSHALVNLNKDLLGEIQSLKADIAYLHHLLKNEGEKK